MKTGRSGGRCRRILRLFLLALVLAGCSSTAEGGSLETATPTVQEAAGQVLFAQHCASCHSTVPDSVVVGPSLAGIAARAGGRVAGMDGRAYLAESINDPSAYLVEGFSDLMPAGLHESLTMGEMEALLAYLLTLN